MSVACPFVCPLPNGLHARPASCLAEAARAFRATVKFVNERSGRTADVRSVLSVVATDTRFGDPCRLEVAGEDELAAVAALRSFVAGALAATDEPLPAPTAPAGAVTVPRALREAGLHCYHAGQPACRGIAVGAAVVAGGFVRPAILSVARPVDAATEHARFNRALTELKRSYEQDLARATELEAGVLRAHLAILEDPVLVDSVAAAIQAGRSAGQAVADAIDVQRGILGAAESAYVRERVLDVEDIATRLWRNLYGADFVVPAPAIDRPSIVFAETLTPTQFLALERRHLQGLVLGHAGLTSHAVILARSFGLPTITGVAQAVAIGRAASEAIVDAELGVAITDIGEGVRRYYDRERAKYATIKAALARVRDRAAATADGRRLEIGANVASVEEAQAAFAQGAEGIGLFRTELLFGARETAPTEEEQFAVYAATVRAAAGKPVIIRTLDIGGDKPAAFLKFAPEANPFLGHRGVRWYAEHEPLIGSQLRALVRAAAVGPLKILVPMVATLDEARAMRRRFVQAQADAKQAGHAVAEHVPLGLMIEVPSTAFLLDELAAEADFFSIGTNDLAQYFFAADRENPKVTALNDPFQPGFVRLLRHIVERVKANGRWVGLCGELAEDPLALPWLVGLGLDEISLAAPRVAATKAALATLDAVQCADVLRRVAASPTREDARAAAGASTGRSLPLLAPELVLLDVDADSKSDAIRIMIDALHVAGRTDAPAAVEEAVWQREDTYSTGFGEGFAIPHGKTDALAANSIVVARLRRPVEWQAMDGKPVDAVILLGIRASEHGKAHMQTLARLARLVTREEFRAAVRAENSPAGMVKLLTEATTTAPVLAQT